MKITQQFDCDGWLQIALTAETVEESAQLARFGLNADAAARKVSHVYAGETAISCFINLHTVRPSLRSDQISRK